MENVHFINSEEVCEVVKEVHEMRYKLSAEFGHDRSQLYAHYQEVEKELRKSGKYRFAEDPTQKLETPRSATDEAVD